MKNSKYTNQLQMFEDTGFKKKVLIQNLPKPKFQIQKEDNEQVEDVFQEMGVQEGKQSEQMNWNQFYRQKIKEIRKTQPCLSHNELTQLVSEEWKHYKNEQKSYKKQFKKIKLEKSDRKSDRKSSTNISEQLDFSIYESAMFIEKLRNTTLKFIINDSTFQVDGKSIIESISNDQNIVYLSQNSSKTETPNEKFVKIQREEEELQSDSDQSIYNDVSIYENKLSQFL